MDAAARAVTSFRERFRVAPPLLVRAPGRVNLIGEHLDHNLGTVLPMAVDLQLCLALEPTSAPRIQVRSLEQPEGLELELDDLEPGEGWGRYVAGVAWALREAGHETAGWRGIIASDLPVGAGLASSAALELAVARACTPVAGQPWDRATMAQLCWRAERERVGVQCGIMDQLVIATARENHALCIDCRSHATRHLPMPAGVQVLILDTGTRRDLTGSAYNQRRQECLEAARRLGVASQQEATPERLDPGKDLPGDLGRRARHVVSEQARVEAAVQALEAGDATALGRLWDASHASLRDDFEVSSEALDTMVALARTEAGCLGARLTGAGFAGCAIALVRQEGVVGIQARLPARYRQATGREPTIHVCQAAGGVELVELG